MTSAQTTTVIKRCVVFAELGGEAVLLNTETGVYFGLDAVGARIWTLLGEGLDDDGVYAHLLEEYDVDADALRADLDRFLTELEQRELTTRSAQVTT